MDRKGKEKFLSKPNRIRRKPAPRPPATGHGGGLVCACKFFRVLENSYLRAQHLGAVVFWKSTHEAAAAPAQDVYFDFLQPS